MAIDVCSSSFIVMITWLRSGNRWWLEIEEHASGFGPFLCRDERQTEAMCLLSLLAGELCEC